MTQWRKQGPESEASPHAHAGREGLGAPLAFLSEVRKPTFPREKLALGI